MNSYSGLVQVKGDLGITGTDDDPRLLAILNASSRVIDRFCNRTFYAETDTKYFDGQVPLFIDDLLSITTLKTDADGDATFENTFATTDYLLYPLNYLPKTVIKLSTDSNYGGFGITKKGCEIDGLWGYGDGISATPYSSSGDSTGDNLSDTATSCDVTDADNFSPGQTILLSAEQCYISAYDTSQNTITLVRGVNGTIAVGHNAGTGIYIYDYPDDIIQVCLMIAGRLFNTRGKAFKSEKLGDYSYTIVDAEFNQAEKALMTPFRKLKI